MWLLEGIIASSSLPVYLDLKSNLNDFCGSALDQPPCISKSILSSAFLSLFSSKYSILEYRDQGCQKLLP